MTTTTINNVTYHVTASPQPANRLLGYDGFVHWLRSAGQRVKAFRRACGAFQIVY